MDRGGTTREGGGDTGGTQEPPSTTEEFKLFDMAAGTGDSWSSLAGDADTADAEQVPLSAQLARFAFTGFNVFISCSALAVAKQMLNPANFTAAAQDAAAAADKAGEQLPAWFRGQYQQRRAAATATRLIGKDIGVLMTASGLWYGLQFGLRRLRGQDDALNVCVAGGVAGGFLGATFMEPVKWSRAGFWGALGGVAGYYGYQQQQVLRAALLQRQQELEQKFMGVAPEATHQRLNSRLLRQLLEMDHRARVEHLRVDMQKHGVELPPSDGGGGAAGSACSGATAAASGGVDGDGDDSWRRLMGSAPWLPQQDGDGSGGGGRGAGGSDGDGSGGGGRGSGGSDAETGEYR